MDYFEFIENVLLYIENNLQENLSLDILSNNFHISKFYFHRLFSAVMGCSLNNYVLSRKLNASIPLIEANNLSLTDIAYFFNFGSQSSYTKAFKLQYSFSPIQIRTKRKSLSLIPIPMVVKRPIKNIKGDLVTDFTLTAFNSVKLSGIAFEVDLAIDDYKNKIHSHAKLLLQDLSCPNDTPAYIVYSNCQPGLSCFKVLFGVATSIDIEKPNYFTIDVPTFFSAKFNYTGDLLDIGDMFATDFARFLKISKMETTETHIELIQVFDSINIFEAKYHIFVPIKQLPDESNL